MGRSVFWHASRYWIYLTSHMIIVGRRAPGESDGALAFWGERRATRSKEAGDSITQHNCEAIDFNVWDVLNDFKPMCVIHCGIYTVPHIFNTRDYYTSVVVSDNRPTYDESVMFLLKLWALKIRWVSLMDQCLLLWWLVTSGVISCHSYDNRYPSNYRKRMNKIISFGSFSHSPRKTINFPGANGTHGNRYSTIGTLVILPHRNSGSWKSTLKSASTASHP